MDSSLSPIRTNLYMEDFEARVIKSTILKPTFWLRYSDERLMIWRHVKDELNNFSNHRNNIDSKIKFTMEIGKNQQFFPIRTSAQKKNKILGHTLYRKRTPKNRY